MHRLLRVVPEVRQALADGAPVVALESTIVAHGMPYPRNLETARQVEADVRAGGAVPATIAVLDGRPCVGLLDAELERLAELGPEATKCSTRDLAGVVAARGHGATTVAGTMALAALAGIDVFVTGGVGGVHRGGQDSLDVSADLTELGRTPVAVVCAGVKSILDIGRTLEVLETQGVPVVGLGTDEFPAFYTPASGVACPARRETPAEVAQLIHASRELGLSQGVLVAVPNLESTLDPEALEAAIQAALADAERRGVAGRDATPFLLEAVREQTQGLSLDANVQLVRNNARVGARVAAELAALRAAAARERRQEGVVVVGGAVLDILAAPKGDLILGTSNPGSLQQSWGGVGRNVAECVARLGGTPVALVSAVGDDEPGRALLGSCRELGIDVEHLTVAAPGAARTAVYQATLDHTGDLCTAIADMDVLETLSAADMRRAGEALRGAAVVVLDGNVPEKAMAAVADQAGPVPLWFEPTSVPKAVRAVRAGIVPRLTYMSPNEDELVAIAREMGLGVDGRGLEELARDVAAEMDVDGHVVLTMGAAGALVASARGELSRLPAPPVDRIVNTSGAGDSFVGGACWALANGAPLLEAVAAGMDAAWQTLGSAYSIAPGMKVSV